MLGRRRVFAEQRRRTKVPGVATGLAWTPTGGDVLFIEATAMPGSGKLTITGQLGDVMKESAQAALSWVRGHWAESRPASGDWFAEHDIHIHVPAGAVPKDGPSAGVAMTVALSSLVSGRPVRNDVAMTGEVTLTGQVLPIGGLKEKSLAAQRAGIKRVLVPSRNEGEAAEIPVKELGGLQFVFVDEVLEAIEIAPVVAAGGRDPAPRRRSHPIQSPRAAPRARSRTFWLVAGLTVLAAVLRFATLGVQSYHHDEVVTASRILRAGFGHAMNAVNFSESTPPLYYALAWVWTQVTGTGEWGLRSLSAVAGVATVPVAYADRGRAARPPRRPLDGGAGRRQPDAPLVLAGGPRLRAAGALLLGLAAVHAAGDARRGAPGLRLVGGLLGPRRRHPLLRDLPDPRRDLPAPAPPRRGRRGRASRSSPPPARRWRRWPTTRCRSGTPTGSAAPARPPALGNRGDLRDRRDHRHHRPPRPSLAGLRAAGAEPGGAGDAGLARLRDARPAAGRALLVGAAAILIPIALAASPKPRTTSSPAT